MKRAILAILILGSACSETSNLNEALTNNNWEVEQVVDLKTGMVKHEEMNQAKLWDFELDHTYCYENKTANQNQSITGKWDLHGYKLLIINEFDTTKVQIEKITDDEMVWLIAGDDSIRFYLTSKARQVVIPDFPNTLIESNKDNNADR